MACKECGSHAINHAQHGRDGSDGDLCDVCYWKKRAEAKSNLCQKCTPVCCGGDGCLAELPPARDVKMVAFGAGPVASKQKPLTDDQIDQIGGGPCWKEDGVDIFMFARAIEAAHGIKGE